MIFKDIKMFNNNSKFYLDTPWINVQKKYEFVPNHTHDGVFSYTIWMKIPYDINEELKIGKYASTFEFIYNSIIGTSFNKIIPVNKNDDPQFHLWEYGVQRWVTNNGFAQGVTQIIPRAQ